MVGTENSIAYQLVFRVVCDCTYLSKIYCNYKMRTFGHKYYSED